MCGIVGYVGKTRDDKTIRDMVRTLHHRGPDDEGVYCDRRGDKSVCLGHARLAILDLSARAHQPFVSPCGRYVLVYNGEIYNFREIRDTLIASGESFASDSDTEVLLKAWMRWGKEALHRCVGMFAFALWDREEEALYLVRDRAGVKPLYYYHGDGMFAFASELKAIAAHPAFPGKRDAKVMPLYLRLGYIPAPLSIYDRTYKLRPGHLLRYDTRRDKVVTEPYWSAAEHFNAPKFERSEEALVEELETILEEAVALRMVSDVPVGLFLSGGYDSTLVTAMLAKRSAAPLRTYTIGFEDAVYDEAPFAAEIARYFGTRHTEYYVTRRDMFAQIETLPYVYDEPFGDSSSIPTRIVAALARKDVKVALSADGGDEIFGGYARYSSMMRLARLSAIPGIDRILSLATAPIGARRVERINTLLPRALRRPNMAGKYLKLRRVLRAKGDESRFWEASAHLSEETVRGLLSDEHAFKRCCAHWEEGLDLLDAMLLYDYEQSMPDDILAKVDRATMSVSLEGREPMLDHRIVEFAARVPASVKYKHNRPKHLLREVLYRHVPGEMVDRPKAGFQFSLKSWLQGELSSYVAHYLDASRIDREVFDAAGVDAIREKMYRGDVEAVTAVWYILMYEMWRERWGVL